MYTDGTEDFSLQYMQEWAEIEGISVEELAKNNGFTLKEGKQNGSAGTTPSASSNQTPAGESSSGGTSLGSPGIDAYLLTPEDLEGSEEEVKARLQSRMAAIGIEIDEAFPGLDAIDLRSKSGKRTGSFIGSKSFRDNALKMFNDFITENGDLSYADQMEAENTEVLQGYYDARDAARIDEDTWEEDYTNNTLKEFQRIEELQDGPGKAKLNAEDLLDKRGDYFRQKYEEWKETGVFAPTDKEIETQRLERQAADLNLAGENYVTSLDSEQQDIVKALVSKKGAELDYRIKNSEKEAASINAMVDDINDQIEAFKVNPTQEDYDAIQARILEYHTTKEEFENFIESVGSEQTKELLAAVKDFNKDYSLLSLLEVASRETANSLSAFIGDVMVSSIESGQGFMPGVGRQFVSGLPADSRKVLAEYIGAKIDQELLDRSIEVDIAREMLAKGPTMDQSFNSIGDFANFGARTLVQAAPSVAMAYTGAAAMPLFFASGYGGARMENLKNDYYAAKGLEANLLKLEKHESGEDELDPYSLSLLKEEIKDQERILNLTDSQKLGRQVVAGIAEVAFEGATKIRIAKGANRALNPLKPKIHVAVGKSMVQEGLSEGATEFVNNVSKNLILGENNNIFEGVGEAIYGGALVGGAMEIKGSAPAAYDMMAFELMTAKEQRDYANKVKRLQELTGLKDLNNIFDPRLDQMPMTQEVAKLVEEIQSEADFAKMAAVGRVGSTLTVEDAIEIGKRNVRMRRLNERLMKAARSGRAQGAGMTAAIKEMEAEFNKLAEERDAIIGGNMQGADPILQNAATQVGFAGRAALEVMLRNQVDAKVINSARKFKNLSEAAKNNYKKKAAAILEQRGQEVTKEAIENEAIVQFYASENAAQIAKDKKSAEELAKAMGMNISFVEMTDAEYTAKFGKGSEAQYVNGKIYVNADVAALNGRIGVYSHELLHAISTNRLGKGNENAAGKKLLEWMEQNSPEAYAYVMARLETSYQGNDAYYEEAMNALSDYISEGGRLDMPTMMRLKTFFNDLFNRASKTDRLSLKDGRQTYAFIARYANRNRGAKTSELLNLFGKAYTEDDTTDNRNRESRSVARLDKIKEAFGKLTPEQAIGNRMVEGELYGIIEAQVNNLAARFDSDSKMDFISEVLVGTLERLRKSPWNGKGTLYGYINGLVRFTILDVLKKDRNSASPMYLNQLSTNALEVLEKETTETQEFDQTTTESKKEAPTYKNLIQRRVLSKETLENIQKKVLSTVRVMKKRMDESVSKNVTVKPYIAELRKTMGKQADIDLKKEMGGLKDGQLRKFLLRNKAAILENMTTTWLMTAMPNAVQKKVDGRWTSDWKGKKIDRESVSTDNAGRTSGAELVRRMPNAATRMSDADFLSNFFNEDGSLIRGRKESLAKAMAEEISFDIINEALKDENSEIRKAYEMRQDLLGVELAANYVTEVARDIERGNVKYSMTAVQAQALRKHQEELLTMLRNGGNVTEARLRNALIKVYIDNNDTSLTEDQLRKIAKDAHKHVNKFINKADQIGAIDFTSFVVNGIEQTESSTNLLAEVGLILEDIFGSFKAMMDVKSIQEERRAVELEYNAQLVEKEGIDGLVKILKWMGGHNYTSTKIGKGRGQYYANKTDYYQNNIALIPGVTVQGTKVFYKGELVEFKSPPSQKAYKTVNGKKVPKTKEDFANEYDERKEQAQEAWSTLTDFLAFVRAQNNPVLWVATMKSLDSNMASLLKAAANVEYYFVGKTNAEVRYEHIIPTNYIMLQLTNHFWNKRSKVDLNALRDAYSVAIIPTDMDANVNLQFQSTMPLKFNPTTDMSPSRYFNITTFGMNNMYALEKIGGENKGTIYGEKWAEFSNSAADNAALELMLQMEDTGSAKFSRSVPRAVFMVGGPGAGKTNVGKGLKLGRRGFKVVNQDLALEPMKEQAGLPANEQQYTKEQRSMRAKLGAAARKAAEAKMEKYMTNRESMVVDGTGASYNATMKKINALRKAGYEVSIVFANTSKAEAIARNKARLERALPDMIVERTWDAVQESAKLYKQEFGDKFYELNTNELKMGEDLPAPFLEKLYADLETGPARYSKGLSAKFNEILEGSSGVASFKVFSKVQAEIRGAMKGRFKFFVPPGADDFRGLVHYAFSGKGKQGDADMAWFEDKLMNPYFKGVEAINRMRQQIKRDYKATIKIFKDQYKMLNKKIGDSGFTYDQALRVYMWDRQGTPVPGISKRDKKLLLDAIKQNPEMVAFADSLLVVARRNEWMEPGEYWQTQTVLSDLNSMTEKIGRKKFLQEFIENAEAIFTEDNLNKIEAIKGRAHREAIEDALYSMKNGTNRVSGSNATVNKFINWINGSTGAIMFFNRRSALLQMLSATNFINWSDNNPLKAAAAFANQKQYWKDWAMIFNSDKLKERRSGLKTDVSESELAQAANRGKGNPQAILAYLLKIGFTPTQIADSFAIATGGASFYRNRVKSYLKEGLSKEQAEEKAWLDFTKLSDEAQQSSDPALVSQQQRSVLGRLVFAFANTPMQYTRLMKKAGLDLINGRGDWKTNVSKIAYYGFVQNFIFSALQSALFALIPGFDDDDEEKDAAKEEAKVARVLDSMLDTILRGSGMYGAIISTVKNVIDEFMKQDEKGFLADHAYTVIAATSISPPINSKLRKIYSAIQTYKFEKDQLEARPFDVATNGRPDFGPGWSIGGSLVSGTLNVPLDRVIDELNSIGEAMDARNSAWQRIALALGWKTWDVGAIDEEGDAIKAAGKEKRKKEGIEKAKETRRKNKEKKKTTDEEDLINELFNK